MSQDSDTKQGEAKAPSPVKNKLNLYSFRGQGIVWDRARNKALCRFEKGRFLTNDIRTIAILVKKQFKYKTKHPVSKDILNEAYSAYKKEIEANEKQLQKDRAGVLKKLKGYDRKQLNSMRISELKVLFKAKKIRPLQVMTKQDMINRLLGVRQ